MTFNRSIFAATLFAAGFVSALTLSSGSAEAQSHHHRHHHNSHAVATARPAPASIIIDADTGRVMESENADSPRYPASLTKMMTLYLTFEALKKDKLSLDDMLPVSQHAASQPQTNIALSAGDHIAVKDAILSIVIRSANDSAVVLGEALGGSEEEFAEKMTAKAHALGMKHTVFFNASGLPEPRQHTTARDMATLGLALRKDFPEYFPFFKTESFNYRGLTYITHNHVMTRYEGVDGIKTGYIRASGFNVVTSATRDNHHIIAAVMGGSTFRARDDKMIALLDKSFNEMSQLPGNRVQLAYSGRVNAFPFKSESESNVEGEGDRPGVAIDTRKAQEKSDASSQQQADISKGGWGIQVGVFKHSRDAEQAANQAIDQAPGELSSSTISIADDAHSTHKAQLMGLTEDQAEAACHKLTIANKECFVYKVD